MPACLFVRCLYTFLSVFSSLFVLIFPTNRYSTVICTNSLNIRPSFTLRFLSHEPRRNEVVYFRLRVLEEKKYCSHITATKMLEVGSVADV